MCTHARQVLFEWKNDVHNVGTAPQADDCTNVTVVYEATDNGSYEVTFNQTGTYYYVCSVADHCQVGQRVTINVS